MPSLLALEGPELVVGLAGAVGTIMTDVLDTLQEEFALVGYKTREIRLSRILNDIPDLRSQLKDDYASEYDRIKAYMKAGSDLRKDTDRGDIFALLAVGKIRSERSKVTGDEKATASKIVYVVNSLKHPDEANTLRDIYGRAFSLVSVYTSKKRRTTALAEVIRSSESPKGPDESEAKAVELITRDEQEGHKLGQRFQDVFPLGDLFVDGSTRTGMRSEVRRYVELLFGHPFHTPTEAEYGMYHAYSASLRSADLSRQVGAAIFQSRGEIVSVGCNEVPKSGGGQYWAGDEEDSRDWQLGLDANVKYRQRLWSAPRELDQMYVRFSSI